ncbi:MAG: hypothetical protein LUO79_04950, partial [Methanomassiliicoccales archaeon]|nr:hypothetical protein [Methanomassiliicoccales archaeon]
MSHLRLKTILVLVVTTVILISVLHLVVIAIVSESFAKVEVDQSAQEITVTRNAMGSELVDIATSARDYAYWDDTYSFVQTGNQSYIDANLVNSTYTNLRVQVIVLLDYSGAIVFQGAHYENDPNASLPSGLEAHLKMSDPLIGDALNASEVTGILVLNQSMMLVSSQPVLKSDQTGPVVGCLLFCRAVDETERSIIEQTLLAHITFYSPSDPEPANILGPTLYAELATLEPVGLPLNDSTYSIWVAMPDIYGQIGLIIGEDLPRIAYAQYQASSFLLASSL